MGCSMAVHHMMALVLVHHIVLCHKKCHYNCFENYFEDISSTDVHLVALLQVENIHCRILSWMAPEMGAEHSEEG